MVRRTLHGKALVKLTLCLAPLLIPRSALCIHHSALFSLVFLYPELYNSTDQVQWKVLVDGKPDRTLGVFVDRQFLLEGRNTRSAGVKPDMMLVGGKIYQITLHSKGRHLVADFLHGLRCSLSDGVSQSFQLGLNSRRKGFDVLINVLGRMLFGYHLFEWN